MQNFSRKTGNALKTSMGIGHTSNAMTFDRWVWVDLEMTGLWPEKCAVLQIAMVITDASLNELVSKDIVVWQPESVLETMTPFVRDLHTKNGLLQRVRTSTISIDEAQHQLMPLLQQHVAYRKGILSGNSVYVDRSFLQKYFPLFEGHLHYRQIDVSSLKVLCQEWFGNRGKPPKKQSTHTALEDIRSSIEELRYYRSNCFRD